MTTHGDTDDLDDWQPSLVLLEFNAIRQLLATCVLKSSYSVPNDLVAPIVLTDQGERLLVKLREQNRRIRYNEGKMAVALQVGWGHEIYVSDSTDISALRKGISSQILNKKISFPLIYGRDLADLLALHHAQETSLSNRKTLKILEAAPLGVFQFGRTVVSPFGCHMSDEIRPLRATFEIPAFKCPRASCSSVHTVRLHTADSAISRARTQLTRLLTNSTPAGFSRRPGRVNSEFRRYLRSDQPVNTGSLISMIADALTLDELRSLTTSVISRSEDPSIRQRMQRITSTIFADPALAVAELPLAHLLGILLTFTDDALIESLNYMVREKMLVVEALEIRAARLQRHARPDSVAELGSLGVRFRPENDSALPARQLSELAHSICTSSPFEAADLAFAMGQGEDTTLPELLDRVYRARDPHALIDQVILGNRHALKVVADALKISTTDRDQMKSSLLWRLGLDSRPPEDVFVDLKIALPTIRDAVGAASERDMRSHFANFFPDLETALLKSLEFVSWALLVDHFASEEPFCFDARYAADSVHEVLTEADPDSQPPWPANRKPTLGQLGTGFGRLAKALVAMSAENKQRPVEDYPFLSRDGVRPFAFANRLMFANLDKGSQDSILQQLRSCSRILSEGTLTGVRNSGFHGNSPFPSDAEISSCFDSVASLLEVLETQGFYPKVWTRRSSRLDELGRGWITYFDGRRELEFALSSWTLTSKMPKAPHEAIVLNAAASQKWGVLRFTLMPNRGPREYWENWPPVWQDKTRMSELGGDVEPHEEDLQVG